MKLVAPPGRAILANPSVVRRLAISPDGTDVIVGQVARDNFQGLSRWTLPDLSPQPDVTPCPLLSHHDTCNVLEYRGETLAVAGLASKQLKLVNVDSGVQRTPIGGDVTWARTAGSLLASSGSDTTIRDLESGRLVWRKEPSAPKDPLYPHYAPLIVFHPNRELFAVGGSGEPRILIHSLSDPRQVITLSGAPEHLHWLGYSPDGEYIAAIDIASRSTMIWRSGETDPYLPEIFGVNAKQYLSIAFHPDGEHCAMGMLSGVVRIYRLSDGKRLQRYREHAGRVQAMDFTPNGDHLLSGGDDGKLLIWNVIRQN